MSQLRQKCALWYVGYGLFQALTGKGIPVFRRRTQRGFIAWLAMAALALLLVVPTVSRTLVALSAASSACAACPDQATTDTHPPAHHDPMAPSALDACGYCTLMSHSPVLTTALVSLLPAVPASLPATTLVIQSAPLVPLPDARPRGPPLS
ncbi:MAG TPA: DUF2946 domain-containing protein [Rhodanobacter sp.]|jgi:hypothetical protein|nr:DUF2946 domain-containing protein [Rhodanobacter sp.]